tara:strand:- start:27295 stop:27783 length:489 start_codon:yes stop_codon:yes gene_type:complete
MRYNGENKQNHMTLHETIKAELKEAMKNKEAAKLRTIRFILSAATNELVASNRTPQEFLTDDETMAVIKRLAKQRKESITQYEAADRPELAEPEKEELEVLEAYLPQMMSTEEIKPVAEAKKAELGIDDKSKMGMLVGAVMKELTGKADGSDVKSVVEALFE